MDEKEESKCYPRTKGSRILKWVGAALVGIWISWFAVCLAQKPMPRALPIQASYESNRFTYILFEPFIGLDFHHNYIAARTWHEGADPYAALVGDPANLRYVYPPLTLVAFGWTDLFPPGKEMVMIGHDGRRTVFAPSEPAILVWLAAILAIVGYAAWITWQSRPALGLPPLPFSLILGAILISYPFLFEFERGNCNVLSLLGIAVLFRAVSWKNRRAADVVIGFCVAFAIGIKPYAIVLVPGLLTLRRFRAAVLSIGWLAVELVILSPELRRWLVVAKEENAVSTSVYMDWSHSIIGHWQLIWRDVGMPQIAKLPAQVTVGCILLAVCAVIGWRVLRRPLSAIAWPYLLWLTAVGTMLLPIAYDYSLLFLPLALLSAWSASDSWRIQACVAVTVLWCQPFFFWITHLPLLILKAGTVLVTGLLILRRLDGIPTVSLFSPTASENRPLGNLRR